MLYRDAGVVIDTGILNLKDTTGGKDLARILPVYKIAVTKVFFLAVVVAAVVAAVMAAVTAVGSFGMPWRSVKGKKEIGGAVES